MDVKQQEAREAPTQAAHDETTPDGWSGAVFFLQLVWPHTQQHSSFQARHLSVHLSVQDVQVG